jgi:hypothetical protein
MCPPQTKRHPHHVSLFRIHPKASKILAKPARRGSPLQSNEKAQDDHEAESDRTAKIGSHKDVDIEGCIGGMLVGDDAMVLMTGFVGAIP